MKYPLIIIFAFFVQGCLAQYPKLKVMPGTGKVYKESDSAKIYFHKFLFFQEKMNKARGRDIDRYEDSCAKYYKLLYRKNK